MIYKLELFDNSYVLAIYKGNVESIRHIDRYQVLREVVNGRELDNVKCFVKLVEDKDHLYLAKKVIDDRDQISMSIFDFVGCELERVKPEDIIFTYKAIADGYVKLDRTNCN